ncbi:MAG: 1,4-dihydroxy-2-naphthoate octaprenyltransferase, partial [Dehalococcoidia bacterium]
MLGEQTRPPPTSWRIWLLAARPATLPAAVAPVLVGTAAAADADLRIVPFIAVLVAAVLLQIGANFANDLSDFERGADHEGRLGPTRVTHAGLVTPTQMRVATGLIFAAAAALGSYLIVIAGWPILVAGLAAIVAALLYTGGPWPYGYHGLGDLFVFIFFGLVAAMGSYYVQV